MTTSTGYEYKECLVCRGFVSLETGKCYSCEINSKHNMCTECGIGRKFKNRDKCFDCDIDFHRHAFLIQTYGCIDEDDMAKLKKIKK